MELFKMKTEYKSDRYLWKQSSLKTSIETFRNIQLLQSGFQKLFLEFFRSDKTKLKWRVSQGNRHCFASCIL